MTVSWNIRRSLCVYLAWTSNGETTMLSWAATFFVIAVIAAFFGFGGIASSASGIAQILFFLFLVLFVVSLIMSAVRGRSPRL